MENDGEAMIMMMMMMEVVTIGMVGIMMEEDGGCMLEVVEAKT